GGVGGGAVGSADPEAASGTAVVGAGPAGGGPAGAGPAGGGPVGGRPVGGGAGGGRRGVFPGASRVCPRAGRDFRAPLWWGAAAGRRRRRRHRPCRSSPRHRPLALLLIRQEPILSAASWPHALVSRRGTGAAATGTPADAAAFRGRERAARR